MNKSRLDHAALVRMTKCIHNINVNMAGEPIICGRTIAPRENFSPRPHGWLCEYHDNLLNTVFNKADANVEH